MVSQNVKFFKKESQIKKGKSRPKIVMPDD